VGGDEETGVVAAAVVMMGGVVMLVLLLAVVVTWLSAFGHCILVMKLRRAPRRCGKSLSASVLMVCVLPVRSEAGGI
jgi:hypothetical protein